MDQRKRNDYELSQVAGVTIRAELEWIWHNKPCLQPNHKLGFRLKSDLIPSKRARKGFLAGNYWLVDWSKLLVMTRGLKYPVARTKRIGLGHTRAYLNATGVKYNYTIMSKRHVNHIST